MAPGQKAFMAIGLKLTTARQQRFALSAKAPALIQRLVRRLITTNTTTKVAGQTLYTGTIPIM